ncbi:hypothetical protein GLYMA_16G010433v4 [Glycine max]|nr:hypothetical protein GLYMA_16G010433v4 [Glycine max]KAH1149381.1 hypothetical protein GYH30_043778 [Glycine max]
MRSRRSQLMLLHMNLILCWKNWNLPMNMCRTVLGALKR